MQLVLIITKVVSFNPDHGDGVLDTICQ